MLLTGWWAEEHPRAAKTAFRSLFALRVVGAVVALAMCAVSVVAYADAIGQELNEGGYPWRGPAAAVAIAANVGALAWALNGARRSGYPIAYYLAAGIPLNMMALIFIVGLPGY